MTTPIATYRLQLRNGFTFADAAKLAPYLAKLGISHVYLSPIFRSAPGSTHGYDAVDFNDIDPLLGGRDGFDALIDELDFVGLKAIVDFVPNHMAAHSDNPWWRDILEWGAQSRYAGYFDIDWSAPKLLCPVLGKQYWASLSGREIGIALEPSRGGFSARYFDNLLPLSPPTYGTILAATGDGELEELGRGLGNISPREWELSRFKLAALASVKRQVIEDTLRGLNEDVSKMHLILEMQPWRLAYWQTAREMLTYRRFFEISDLIGVRVEQPDVFADVHRTVLSLIDAGKIDGLRIDHIDGLADPKAYLTQLRRASAAAPDLYLVVEKILGEGEETRADWPIDGTTGYEFIRDISGVFIGSHLQRLDRGYNAFTSKAHDYVAEVLAVKRRTLSFNLAAELRGLVALAATIASADVATRDFGPDALRTAIIELASHFSVYRTYIDSSGASPADMEFLQAVASLAKSSRMIDDPGSVDFIVSLLTGDVLAPHRARARAFAIRFQQTTGPLMAKAVEDTEFYRFNRLIALNEVGCEPGAFPTGQDRFHAAMLRRQARAPRAMTATATHDTKRGEDARVRLYGLSTIQEEWCAAVERWSGLLNNSGPGSGAEDLDREGQWLFYQALAGAWPASGDPSGDFVERIEGFMFKAVREAKCRTSWTNPDMAYEAQVRNFVRYALEPRHGFVDDFGNSIAPLLQAGRLSSLVQTVLKILSPGVPDIYQGTELWDFSFVDPDNRRPVDFETRQRLLAECFDKSAYSEEDWRDGRVKLDVLRRCLSLRRQVDFSRSSYEPLQVDERSSGRALAFMRRNGDGEAIIVIGGLASAAQYKRARGFGFDGSLWRGTTARLPEDIPRGRFSNVFSGTIIAVTDGVLGVAEALQYLPVAVLRLVG